MRILVTGISGFIGSALAPALAERGHEVRGVGRATRSLEEAFHGCDVVVHLANLAHTPADRALLWKVNVEGTLRIAQLAVSSRVRRLVYLSSIKASGEETAGRPFDGSEAPQPADEYGRSKLAAEQAIQAEASGSSLDTVVLRSPLVYGPRVKANFLALLNAIARGFPLPFGSIANRRSLIYVGNLVSAIERCVEAQAVGRRVYMASDGAALSTPQLCRAIGEALGRPARLFAFPPALLPVKRLTRSLEIDDSALRQDLGWAPRHSLEEGLRETAQWYRRR